MFTIYPMLLLLSANVFSLSFSSVKTLPQEHCQACRQTCLPPNPENAETSETANMHVERLYCGHLFHLRCLVRFMKTPPFHGNFQQLQLHIN